MDGTQTSEETVKKPERQELQKRMKDGKTQTAESGKSWNLSFCGSGGRHNLHLDCMPLWAHLGNEVGNNNKQSSRDMLVNVKWFMCGWGFYSKVRTRRIYIANFAIFKFAVFCLTIYTCPEKPELSASTKLRDFLDRYCACPTISYFFLRSGVLTTACVCVCVCVWRVRVMCVCVMYVCACLCVCSRMCVCITQMSSFSNFDIIVLNWGAYKCVCVCVCV